MIHGCFFFVRSMYDTKYTTDMVSGSPYFRTAAYGTTHAKQFITRSYMMITGNNMAAAPELVATPGIRPMTSQVEPWLHAGGVVNMVVDGAPMYRERLVKMTITYKPNGICEAEAVTLSVSPTAQTNAYFNNVAATPPAVATGRGPSR